MGETPFVQVSTTWALTCLERGSVDGTDTQTDRQTDGQSTRLSDTRQTDGTHRERERHFNPVNPIPLSMTNPVSQQQEKFTYSLRLPDNY